jgi:hypothetical protein
VTTRTVLVVICLAVAAGWIVQPIGDNQSAHYVTIQSLAVGKTNVDDLAVYSHDLAWTGGHYHAAKSPGLDLLLAPAARTFESAGMTFHNVRPNDRITAAGKTPARDVWLLTLIGALIPAMLLLALVSIEAERLRRGSGTIAAVALGTGSLIFPFSTLLFSHVLSALLGFAGMTMLLRAQASSSRRKLLTFAAGLTLGLAAVVEYPVALFALIALAYVVASRLRRRFQLLPLVGGLALGVAPLPAYTWWAYGSPKASTYAGAISVPGRTGHDVLGWNSTGFFGITHPDFHALLELLLGGRGLFVVTPITAIGLVGLVQLFRRGERTYALIGLTTFALFLLYDCSYWLPFGGGSPGPRFLIPTLPFLAVGVATAWSSLRGVAIPLLLASATTMAIATTTVPMFTAPTTSVWWHVARLGHFVETIGPGGIAVVFAAVGCSLLVLVPARPQLDLHSLKAGLAGLAGWSFVFALGPPLFAGDLGEHRTSGAYVAVAIALAAALGTATAVRRNYAAAAAILTPLAVALLPGVRGDTRLEAILAIGALTIATLLPLARTRRRPEPFDANRARQDESPAPGVA